MTPEIARFGCAPSWPKMVTLTAVMRKLLHAIYGMFKHQKPFDGSKVYPIPTTEISTEVAA